MNTPIADRIMERVCKMPAEEGGCWMWTGATTKKGYGVIRYRGETKYVHRLMAKEYGYEIEGLTIDHLCRTRTCVNPMHIMPCSRQENARREMSPAWQRVITALMAAQNGERSE